MNTLFETLCDYERRSLAHAPGNPLQNADGTGWRGLGYRVGEWHLVSDHAEVREILGVPALTVVPGAKPWLLGLANVRGNLLPVVDLKQFMEGQRSVPQERQRVLVVCQPGGDVGVLVDELYGQRFFAAGEEVGLEGRLDGRYAMLVEKIYRQGEKDWAVFSLDRLSRTPEFRQAAA